MKSFLYSVVIVLAALPATAGITYDFHTSTTGLQAAEQQGHVIVDGANLRMELATGDGAMFQNGSVLITHNGGATIAVLDPQAKSYWELDLSQLSANALAGMLEMKNEKVNVRDAGDGGTLEGYATKHKIVTASADMSVGGAPAGMHFDLTMESWATDKLPTEAAAFLQRRLGNTGLPVLDKLIAAQSDAVKGFPLKQITIMKVTGGASMELMSTTDVTNVKKTNVAPALFEIPKDYKKTENPLQKMAIPQ